MCIYVTLLTLVKPEIQNISLLYFQGTQPKDQILQLFLALTSPCHILKKIF